jgi:ubiquitin carboxyl-terminal hydrolase 8
MDIGIVGLRNRGNTCYLNTSLQCLSHTPLFTDYFISNNYVPDLNNRLNDLKTQKNKKINEIILTREYAKLIKVLWNSSTPIEPKTFHELIQKYDDRFAGFEQQDTQESLALILDYLNEGLKYDVEINYSGTVENKLDELVVESCKSWQIENNNKYSIIIELFFGQFINKIISQEPSSKGKLVSKKFEMFNMLNVPIHGLTLYDSLAKYFEKEILETKYLDESTNKYISAYKEIKLMKVPKYIIIVLKRYNNDKANLGKSNNNISFPIDDLDLSSYSEGYDKFDCKLRLVSVGCHKGGLNGGHYFAICRHKHQSGKWYKYDDETVSEFNIMIDKNKLFKDGYLLIYEKNE